MNKVDLITFVVMALACAWDFWEARNYPGAVARRERLKAAGLFVYVLVLPASVFLMGTVSVTAWLLLCLLLVVVGSLLFYWPNRSESA